MLTNFSKIFQKSIDEDVIDSYFQILKSYSDDKIRKAGYRCLEDAEFFPKPAQILKHIDKNEQARHNQDERTRYTCPICNNYVHAMIEGRCWDCHEGVPLSYGRTPFKNPAIEVSKTGFSMSQDTKCLECGRISMCIKEPADTGIWKCRECYNGVTDVDFSKRISDLVGKLGELRT